jgi:hypothetical protein
LTKGVGPRVFTGLREQFQDVENGLASEGTLGISDDTLRTGSSAIGREGDKPMG